MRVLALAALFAAEAAVATVLLDGAAPAPRDAWLTILVHRRGAWAARCAIGFAALFATFAYLRYGTALARISDEAGFAKIRGVFLAGHALAMGAFAALSTLVYTGRLSPPMSNLVSAAWLMTVVSAIATAALAVIPWSVWTAAVRATGSLWAWAAGAAIAAGSAYPLLRLLWRPTSRLTFVLVQWMGRPFFGDLALKPEKLKIGTQNFSVIIADECSGLEGIGLMLVFGMIWLILFRDEIRFPQALLLLPAGIVSLFLLNSVRILGLIAIGNAGAKDVALGGFHSQAGWLAFNSVAFGLCAAARKLPWISIRAREPKAPAAERHDSTAALLTPFLAILAAGMVSQAISGAFEWWYALRFVAAGAALVIFRREYAAMDWRPGWTAAGAGVAVCALWIAMDRMAAAHTVSMPAVLGAASPAVRSTWIVLRVLGAVITVPIAEELAFRGYLMRRLISADFETVSPRAFSWFSLLGSALIFGLMHGSRWPAGAVAGLIYGAILLRRGRIGDAIAAHAITNGLLAIYVLAFGQWQLW